MRLIYPYLTFSLFHFSMTTLLQLGVFTTDFCDERPRPYAFTKRENESFQFYLIPEGSSSKYVCKDNCGNESS